MIVASEIRYVFCHNKTITVFKDILIGHKLHHSLDFPIGITYSGKQQLDLKIANNIINILIYKMIFFYYPIITKFYFLLVQPIWCATQHIKLIGGTCEYEGDHN